MLHTVRSMLADNDYVHVFSFDFSKAFDTVRHTSLTSKLAQLELPDIYNWAVNFFEDHAHWALHQIRRCHFSNTQRHSRIGARSRVLHCHCVRSASCSRPKRDHRRIFKFADDTYLIVPGVNTDTCGDEIQHLQAWAADNNLQLNQDKTKEIVIMASRKQAPPPQRPDVWTWIWIIIANLLTDISAMECARLRARCSRQMASEG